MTEGLYVESRAQRGFYGVLRSSKSRRNLLNSVEGSATKEISYTFPRNQVKSLEINGEINRNHMELIKKSLEVDQKSDVGYNVDTPLGPPTFN